jgi:hypothetical protein
MIKPEYACCFCNQRIEPSDIDITSLLVIANWEKIRDQQHDQQMFCHFNCLKEKLYEGFPLYIETLVGTKGEGKAQNN